MSIPRRFLPRIILIAGIALCASHGVRAQSADSVFTIGEITVTASREGVHPSRAPQRVTVLDADAVDASASRTVADLLEARSTLFIRRQGQGLATISQRGGSPSQTQLLVDGLRLTDPQLGQFDLSLLPSHLFRSVEILHGPGSAIYGTDGMSGIVHLRSARGAGTSLSLSSEIGAYGERRVSTAATVDVENVSALVAAEYARADGNFPFRNEASIPARDMRRRNADRQQRSLFTTVGGSVGRHALRLALLFVQSEQGIPGISGASPQGERRWDEHVRFWMEDRLPLGAGAVNVRAFVHHSALRYSNPQLDLDETGRTRTGAVEAELRHPVGSSTDISIGTSLGHARAQHPSLAKAASEAHGSAFSSAIATFGRARVYPAVRVDAYRTGRRTQAAASPRLGINVQPVAGQPLYVRINAGTGFRVPTFNQRYWQPGGNPDLVPEHVRSFDAGLVYDAAGIRADLAGFAARYEDQIVWTSSGDMWVPENLSQTVSRGLEAGLEIRGAVTAGAMYSYTFAVDRSDPAGPSFGRQLRYVPRHQAKAFASGSLGPVRMDLHARFLGRRFVTSDETQAMEPTFVADAQVGVVKALGPVRARLSVLVENVLDAQYAVIQGYPMPPRHARLRLLLETR